MKKFEYKTEWNLDTDDLNECGHNGWELWNTVSDLKEGMVYIFKREIEEDEVLEDDGHNKTILAVGSSGQVLYSLDPIKAQFKKELLEKLPEKLEYVDSGTNSITTAHNMVLDQIQQIIKDM